MAKIAIPVSLQSLITVCINLMDTIILRFVAVFASIFTAITIISPEWIMRIYSDETAIITLGITYLQWMIPTYLCTGLSLTCTIVLRTVGQVRIPLYCSISAFFVNVFFNRVFIFGILGAPRMEIGGAALGTLIARVFELMFICGYFFFIDKRIRYRLKNIFMKYRDLLGEYIRISIPVLISDGLLAFGNNTVAMIMGRIGKTFVAPIPLSYLAGLKFGWPSFWIYTSLKIDQIIKYVWCYFRLRSGKWLKKIKGQA